MPVDLTFPYGTKVVWERAATVLKNFVQSQQGIDILRRFAGYKNTTPPRDPSNYYHTPYMPYLQTLGFTEVDDPTPLTKLLVRAYTRTIHMHSTYTWHKPSQQLAIGIPIIGTIVVKKYPGGYGSDFKAIGEIRWPEFDGIYIEMQDGRKYFALRGSYQENENTLRLLVQLAKNPASKLIYVGYSFQTNGPLPEKTFIITKPEEFAILCASPNELYLYGAVKPEAYPTLLTDRETFELFKSQLLARVDLVKRNLATLDYLTRLHAHMISKDFYERLMTEMQAANIKLDVMDKTIAQKFAQLEQYAKKAGVEVDADLRNAWTTEIKSLQEIISKDLAVLENSVHNLLKKIGEATQRSEYYPGAVTAAAGTPSWVPLALAAGGAMVLLFTLGGEKR